MEFWGALVISLFVNWVCCYFWLFHNSIRVPFVFRILLIITLIALLQGRKCFQMNDLHIPSDYAFLISNSSIIMKQGILTEFTKQYELKAPRCSTAQKQDSLLDFSILSIPKYSAFKGNSKWSKCAKYKNKLPFSSNSNKSINFNPLLVTCNYML